MIRRTWMKGVFAGVASFAFVRWAKASQIVFQAEGEGSTLKEAQTHALEALSQQILSDVSSEVSQTVTVQGEQVSKQAQVHRALKSHLLLKGVKFEVLDSSQGKVRVLAVMDAQAVAQTIRYLQQTTTFLPESLKLSDVAPLREKVRMLQAILMALPASLKSRYQSAVAQAQQKASWLRKRETQALWVLNLQGKAAQARVWVDGRLISTAEPIFLTPGRHDYRIEREGYFPVEGVLRVRAGQRVEQTVDWIPAREGMPVALEVSDSLAFISKSQWQDWLASLGLVWQPHAQTVLRVNLRDQVSRADLLERHHLALSLAFYHGARRLKRLRTRFEVTTYQGEWRPVQKAVIQKIEQALKVLVSKTPLRGG